MKLFIIIMGLFLIGYALAYYAALPSLRRVVGPRYVVSVAIMTLACAFAPNAYAFWAACAFALLATVRTRQEAICRYIMLIALVPDVGLVIQVGGLYLGNYTAPTAVTLATLVATWFLPAGKARPVPRMRAEDGLILTIYVVYFIASPGFTPITGVVREMVFGALVFLLPYYLIRRNVRTPEEVCLVLGALIVAGLSVSIMALYETREGWALFDPTAIRLSQINGLAASASYRGSSLRASVAFGQPLMLAFFLILCALAIFAVRAQFRKMPWRLCAGLLLITLLAPQSRGALIAIVPGFIVLLATQRRYGAAAAVMAVSGVGAVALLILRSSSDRIAAFMGAAQKYGVYFDYRQALLDRGMQEVLRHPLFGQPIHSVLTALDDLKQGEHLVDLVNIYLNIALVSGLVGLVAAAAFMTVVLRKLVARAQRTALLDATRAARTFVLAALTATLVYMSGISFAGRVPMFLALLIALSRTVSASLVRRRASLPAERRPEEASPAWDVDRAEQPVLAPI